MQTSFKSAGGGHNDLCHPTSTKDKPHLIKIDKKVKRKSSRRAKIKYIFIIVLTSVLEKTKKHLQLNYLLVRNIWAVHLHDWLLKQNKEKDHKIEQFYVRCLTV